MNRKEFAEMLQEKVVDSHGYELWCWGIGNTAQLYQQGLMRLGDAGVRLAGYVVTDKPPRMTEAFGKPLISAEELSRKDHGKMLVAICSPQPRVIREITATCNAIGVKVCMMAAVVLQAQQNEVLACYDLLADETSREVYAQVIRCHLEGTVPPAEVQCGDAYFCLPEFSMREGKEVFVDCGAFVGDSLEQYIWKREAVFRKIIAFEPDARNYAAMQKRVARLCEEWAIDPDKIVLMPFGVDCESHAMAVDGHADDSGLSSHLAEPVDGAEGTCNVKALDDCIAEPIGFLKADIESYEYRMLVGAKRHIVEDKPLIAVCIYHNAVDLYSVQLLLHQLVPNYKFYVRHHSAMNLETVLYAVYEG